VSDTTETSTRLLKDLWDGQEAARLEARPLDLLRYRSNLLGADLRITNFGAATPARSSTSSIRSRGSRSA